MILLLESIDQFNQFMNKGGQVLWLILFTAICIWFIVIERALFFKNNHAESEIASWRLRADKSSWSAHQIRFMKISQNQISVDFGLSFLNCLIVLCPLLGLLGTVTGMIDVFTSMAAESSNNAKNMAAGVSKATIPTMAGMLVALSGLLAKSMLDNKANKLKSHYAHSLEIHH